MTPIFLCDTTQTEGFINLRNHSQNHIEIVLKRKEIKTQTKGSFQNQEIDKH
jgi:hypothetical protein